MIPADLRGRVDALWEAFWTGGITNPLTTVEQITYLLFLRMLDMQEPRRAGGSARRGESAPAPLYGPGERHLRWSSFKRKPPGEMLRIVRDEVFPHLRELRRGGSTLREHMKGAELVIQKAGLLAKAVAMIDELPLDGLETSPGARASDVHDIKGDLYEHVLGKLTTAGINGQFRTPRHIVRHMIEMIEPKPTDVVGDPACGTAGFLASVKGYLDERRGARRGALSKRARGGALHGFDVDRTMLRIATMNLALHGVESPDIRYQDALSSSFTDRFPEQASDHFDVILANPPFKGSLDAGDVHPSLSEVVTTKRTELLFLALIRRMLKVGGRSATIVPCGVLFGSSKAHVAIRRALVDEDALSAVISLPSGVFKPYAGVSTAILVFTKGGSSEHVFFYDVEADGLSLDDRREPVKENDLPDALARWRRRDPARDTDRASKAFMVPAREIRDNGYDLAVHRYRKLAPARAARDAESPGAVLARLRRLEGEIGADLRELEAML